MNKDERSIATELAQVKLYLRRIERDSEKVKNPRLTACIDEACKSLDVAVLAASGQEGR